MKNQNNDEFGFGGTEYQAMATPAVSQPKNMHSFKISLCGKRKKVIKGKYKGHEGIVRNILGTKVEFELAAECKVVHLPLNHLNIPAKDLDFNRGIENTERSKAMTGMSSKINMKHNMMTPAYEPDTQFNGWGES